ncbi:MAG: ABC transporter ATP-binding protein [Proteobacteria bacterium]|nr:ABC transporter ATP-binding protein [Pseudomonadota bacterium]MBU1610635.1 ABC transporter ATP-binding protein [Pseudomonadota bacterium]
MFFGVSELSRSFGRQTVLDSVSFAVEQGEIVSIIGPSGVGKTTLLKIIAGLDEPDSGSLHFATSPSRDNPVILVFQDYILFPNLTVFENVAFGLRTRKLPQPEVEAKVMEVLGYFHLADRRESYPSQLSAGQKQRVALGRAMVVNPMLLLLDEPFANLDRNLKMETAEFIRDTQKAFGVTTISVTHDLEEAFVMSDRIGVMLGGRLVQYDTASEVYVHPVNREAGEFLGPMNEIGPALHSLLELPPLAACNGTLLVRPECLALKADEQGAGLVRDVVFAGHYTKYIVEIEGVVLVAYGQFDAVTQGGRVRIAVRDCLEA